MKESKAVLKYELKESLQTFVCLFVFGIFRTLASDDLKMKSFPFYVQVYIFSFNQALFVCLFVCLIQTLSFVKCLVHLWESLKLYFPHVKATFEEEEEVERQDGKKKDRKANTYMTLTMCQTLF